MNSVKIFFFKLNNREQTLLLISLWIVVLVCMFKILQNSFFLYQEWQTTQSVIEGHEMVLNLKPAIDKALEKQKLEQANKSFNKTSLSNKTDSISRLVYEGRDYKELDTEERERYSQHKVRIKFARATYEQVNQFTSYVRAESPYMFLSEVKIEPRYPARPDEITKYDALFVVSSVEFVN